MPWGPQGEALTVHHHSRSLWTSVFHWDSAFCFGWKRKTLKGYAAEPFIPSRGDPARTAGCDRHMAVHGRLDVIEETVEKTVEHLEAEVKGLLAQLEELAWNLPPGPFSLIPDLAEETIASEHQSRSHPTAGSDTTALL
ncbi:placenta-specific protein 9 isoform X3 [Monodon monoceros]|uniref:placenta-specific protein 9 isoform X3 n=1 Tax=Monodon monoceros TaxID=40151 RepID=UPI0010F9D395|nr:placenta-specific protein 9 isoform X3 [Monodon monoceros]